MEMNDSSKIQSVIRTAINRHLVQHVNVDKNDTRCRVDLLIEEAADEIMKKCAGSINEEWQDKLQMCYDEIWKNMVYPISMKGHLKADDILKREFPFLKPDAHSNKKQQ